MRDQVRTSYRISSVAMVSKAIGGVAPLGWINPPAITLIYLALNDYDVIWAAAGHPHAVFPTSYAELLTCTGAKPMIVGD